MHLTHTTKPAKEADVKRNWHLVDLRGKVLGREVTKIAELLIGKHKPEYSSHTDSGDHVVVVNASHFELTGRKMDQKIYTRYSGYQSGLKEIPIAHQLEKDPKKIIEHAVSGMLPKNKLRDRRLRRLHVYKDNQHPYENKFKG